MDYSLWKNDNFAFILNPCLYCLERLVYRRERDQILFLEVFCIKKTLRKFQIGKCQFCGFLKPTFSMSSKACLLNKMSKIVFSRFIFTMYYMEIQGVTEGYMGLQRVTRGYRRLQEVTRGYRGLQRTIETFFSN